MDRSAVTDVAIGCQDEPHQVDEKFAARDAKPRERMPIGEIVIDGGF